MSVKPLSKAGAHGTLHLYELQYTEHATERFFEAPDTDGWELIQLDWTATA